MDAKEIITYKLLCNSCLCVGQTLNLLTDTKLKQFYLDALNEIPICGIVEVTPVLCCDCEALLRRAMLFKNQVKDSYQILLSYSSEYVRNGLITDLAREPRLAVKSNDVITIDPDESLYKYDEQSQSQVKNEDSLWECDKITVLIPDTNKARPNRTQQVYLKDMKLEDEKDVNSNHASDADFEPDMLTEIDSIINKKKKRKKNTKDKHKKNNKKTKGNKVKAKKETKNGLNIITIDLTYDEMMLERDRDCAKETYINSKYKCESCIIGFLYYKSYKTHVTQKHSMKNGDYTCPVCKTIHASVDAITAHYKRHLRRYECSICKKRTMDIKVMQQHYYSSHDISLKKYKCEICGKVSNSRDTHRYHTESHRARLQCPQCDKTFRHRAGLLNHRLAVHEFNNKFPCTVCDKVFRWRTSLTRHQESHDNKTKPMAAYCEQCAVSFSSLCSYQRHVSNSLKHITKDQLRFICDHCKVKFADKTKLRDHIEEKHLHKTFSCHICLKTSKNRVSLDQHIRNVHKGRPNNKMCHHCGKGFPTKLQLESHIRTHTGERPFICEYCPTTFSQQSNLYKHNRQVHHNLKTKRYTAGKKDDSQCNPTLNPTPTVPVSVVLHYTSEGYLTAQM